MRATVAPETQPTRRPRSARGILRETVNFVNRAVLLTFIHVSVGALPRRIRTLPGSARRLACLAGGAIGTPAASYFILLTAWPPACPPTS